MQAATTDFINSNVPGSHWTPAVWLHLSMPLWIHGLITANILAGVPRTVMDKLQCVLNAAACIVTSTRKFDHGLGQILHDELHWLDVRDQMFFKLAVPVRLYLNGHAPLYLSDYCVPVARADTWWHLHSANSQQLAVPHYWLNTYGCRAFLVAGPTIWNSPGFHPGPDHHCRLFQTFA